MFGSRIGGNRASDELAIMVFRSGTKRRSPDSYVTIVTGRDTVVSEVFDNLSSVLAVGDLYYKCSGFDDTFRR